MKNRYFINSILKLLIMLIISGLFAQSSNEPSWVNNRQKQIKGYYVGFGSAATIGRSENEFIQKANESAFLEISNQISTEIHGSGKIIIYEDENTFINKATFETESSSIAELEGLEIEEKYKSGNRYYVLWKLSKKKHLKNIDKYSNLAQDYYKNSIKSVLSPVNELGFLVKGYESVLRAHGQIISVNSIDGRIVLNTYFLSRIEQIFSKINTQAVNTLQSGRRGRGLSSPIIFRLQYKELVTVPLKGIPVKFYVSEGEMNLTENTITDSKGESQTNISNIISQLPTQKVRAQINLLALKISSGKNAFLDRKLNEMAALRSESYAISVTTLTAERIAVKILPQAGIPKGQEDFINEKFIAELKKLTDYTVIERALMEDVLKENEFNAEDCSTEECQVQIGKILAVRKMIYVLLWKYGSEFTGTVKLVNIESGENEHSESVSYKGSVTDLVKEGVPQWIRSFYTRLNTAKITITSGNPSINIMSNGLTWGKIPIFEKEIEQGNYKVNFSSPGFESLSKNYIVALGQQISEDIKLRPKSRGRALSRSLFFPGLGQFYSSDINHQGRRLTGVIYSSTAALSLIGTAYSLNEFSKATNNYKNLKSDYLNATQLDDIENKRIEMVKSNSQANDARSMVITIGSITAGLWLWSAIDSFIFFPNNYGRFTFEPSIKSNVYGKYASLTISKKF